MAFKPRSIVGLDTETTGVYPWRSPGHPAGDRPFAVSMCDQDGGTWYTEWPVNPFTRVVTPNDSDVQYLVKILTNPKLSLRLFNAKFDFRMLDRTDSRLRAAVQDVISTAYRSSPRKRRFEEVYFAAKLCNSQEGAETAGRGGYGLKDLCHKYLDIPKDDQKTLGDRTVKARAYGKKKGWKLCEWGKSPKVADYWMVKLAFGTNECEEYAVQDAVRTLVLGVMYDEILDEEEIRSGYEREMQAWPVVWYAEESGFHIRRKENLNFLTEARKNQKKHLATMREMCGDPEFEPGSHPKLGRVLFDHYGLKVSRRTKTGKMSTDIDALGEISHHPFVQVLKLWRSSEKADSTFFGKYHGFMVPDETTENPSHFAGLDARIRQGKLTPDDVLWILHPSINQVEAATGRTSCSNPNLQQVADPTKSVKGNDPIPARAPFGPRPGYYWYSFDWAQQEARIFADISQVPFMINAIREGRDVNTEMAERAWGGRGNPAALKAMAHALEFGQPSPSTKEVEAAWRFLGWDRAKAAHGMYSPEALDACQRWMAEHEYSITKSEKAVGKVSSRGRAKMVMFASIYGGGWRAIVNLLMVQAQEAKDFVYQFHKTVPEVRVFMKQLIQYATFHGHVHTKYGRRINIDPEYAYKCVDYVVQGTAADMLKDVMIRTDEYFRRTRVDARFLLPVHDEGIFEVSRLHATKPLLRGIRNIMQDTRGVLNVPMIAECARIPYSWASPVKGVL